MYRCQNRQVYGNDICMTSSGHYALTGSIKDSLGNVKSLVMMIDENGDTLWTKTFSDANAVYSKKIILLKDSTLLIAGNRDSSFSLIKADLQGNVISTKSINFPGAAAFSYTRITATSDSGFLISGMIDINSIQYSQALIKCDASCNVLWSKAYPIPVYRYDIAESDGEIMIASDGMYLYITCLDTTGNFKWQKSYDFGHNFQVGSIRSVDDNGYIVSGMIIYSAYESGCILRIDSTGNILWSKILINTDDIYDCIQYQSDFFVYGYRAYGSDYYSMLLRLDSVGNNIWSKVIGTGFTEYESGFTIGDSGIIFCQAGIDHTISTNLGIYVCKTDFNGNSGCRDTSFSYSESTTPPLIDSTTISDSTLSLYAQNMIVTGTSNNLILETFCTSVLTDIGEVINDGIKIYPNPADNFIINMPNDVSGTMKIFDAHGNLVFIKNIQGPSETIDISNVQSGIFYIQVCTKDGNIFGNRLIHVH